MRNTHNIIFNRIYKEITYRITNTTFIWFIISLFLGIFVKGIYGIFYSLFFVLMILFVEYDIYSFHILRRILKDREKRYKFIEEIADHIYIQNTDELEKIPINILVDTSNAVMRLYYR